MKASTFILKRVYLERNAEREYKQHQQRLESIKTHPMRGSVSTKVQKQDDLISKTKMKHQRAIQFLHDEKQREEKVENKALINKLLEINDGRFAISNIMKDQQQTAKSNGQGATKQHQLFKSQSSMISLNHVHRKQLEEKIQKENEAFANRMIHLPPVIKKKELQDKEFEQAQSFKKNILRYHQLKEKQEVKYQKEDNQEDDGIDVENEELMNEVIHILVSVKDISFINFLPQNTDDEQYFYEIQASVTGLRRTVPEFFEDFSKSIINQEFNMRDLKKSKILYIGLWQVKKKKERFLGDFELDLTPYYKQQGEYDITFDLRNYKELRLMPNYMHKDMRKKGIVSFDLKVRSNIEKYFSDGYVKPTKNPEYQYTSGELVNDKSQVPNNQSQVNQNQESTINNKQDQQQQQSQVQPTPQYN